MKNAPAVTARRATNQIVLVADHQALAAIVVVSLPATAAETLAIVVVVGIVLVVIVLAEQTVRVVTMRLIDHVVMAHRLIDRAAMVRLARLAHLETVPIPRGLHAMAIAHIHRARFVTEMPDRAVMAHRLIDLVAMATIDLATHVAMVILQVGLRVPGETGPIRRAPRATACVQIVRALTARIGHAPIALTATSRAVSGSPMGESVVRFARR